MDAELRKILSKLVLEIRHLLEGIYDDRGVWHAGDLEQRLNQIGVWRDRPAKPLEELPQLSEVGNKARRTVDAYIKYRKETGVNRAEAVEEFIRESAYTWFNRLFALRCMEARGIIDPVILQKDIYGGRSLQHNRLAIRHPELCAGEDDGLFAVLFQEFERRAHELPMLFNPDSPAVALRPSVSVVKRLVAILSGREAVNSDYASDEVFIAPDSFGWAYQYWNAEEKDRVFERVRTKKAKIDGKDIIPVTCIYTEPYMVKFLVQNSLGALWSCMHSESKLYEKWEYYVKDADRSLVENKRVREITFLDPACGSGHFLLEAFDLFYDMYREEGKLTRSDEICASILENNLYGIDIDERAVQIGIAVLWMKAKKWAPELDTSGLSSFRDHLVATNIRLPGGRDHLDEFLRKHPEDRPLRNALMSIFMALENVDEIGSLLKIKEPLVRAFEGLKNDAGIQTTLWSNGFTSVDSWRESVIEQLQEHFSEEAVSSDLSQAFFGQSMNKGLRLIKLLSSKHDIVATNPPYMGSGNMGYFVKRYIESQYKMGKRDLYAAFIIRCKELSASTSKIAMVTQQSWMFLGSYTKLREKLLFETSLELLAHLGPSSFSEISGEIVNIVIFVINKGNIKKNIITKFFDARIYSSPEVKSKTLIKQDEILSYSKKWISFRVMPEYRIMYEAPDFIYNLFDTSDSWDQGSLNNSFAIARRGLDTCEVQKWVRYWWEIKSDDIDNYRSEHNKPWVKHVRGSEGNKWSGRFIYIVLWGNDGNNLKIRNKAIIPNEKFYFKQGATFSRIGDTISARMLPPNTLISDSASGLYSSKVSPLVLVSLLNSRIVSFLLGLINPTLNFQTGDINSLPTPRHTYNILELDRISNICHEYKKKLVENDPIEYSFNYEQYKILGIFDSGNYLIHKFKTECLYSLLKGISDNLAQQSFVSDNIPKNYFGYLPTDFSILQPHANEKLYHIKEIKKIVNKIMIENNALLLSKSQQTSVKKLLKTLYSKGPGFKINEEFKKEIKFIFNYEDIIPLVLIPSETYLEELSNKLQIHPLSIYLLLKEGIEQESWRCIPEECRLTEDRFTVIILRLLGHRWNRQIEAGEPVPNWADPDGIIPITKGTDEPPLLDRIRERINKDLETDNVTLEIEFKELMGKTLEEWLQYDFFKHHIGQFKKRPVAWLIQSTPRGGSNLRRGGRVEPAFSCLVYCQKVDEDTLHKIRSQYVGPLKNGYEAELRTLETIGDLTNEQTTRRTRLELIIDELEEFDTKLMKVITEGFDSKELKELIEDEPLDKWCSIDGKEPPPDRYEGLYLQERAYIPDVNDGVRVNIVPLQKAGLLASDVLAKKDLDRAISDRAKWRSDERRWCREEKLPQPGWWEKRKLDDKPR